VEEEIIETRTMDNTYEDSANTFLQSNFESLVADSSFKPRSITVRKVTGGSSDEAKYLDELKDTVSDLNEISSAGKDIFQIKP
jgi:hypothetical protein